MEWKDDGGTILSVPSREWLSMLARRCRTCLARSRVEHELDQGEDPGTDLGRLIAAELSAELLVEDSLQVGDCFVAEAHERQGRRVAATHEDGGSCRGRQVSQSFRRSGMAVGSASWKHTPTFSASHASITRPCRPGSGRILTVEVFRTRSSP